MEQPSSIYDAPYADNDPIPNSLESLANAESKDALYPYLPIPSVGGHIGVLTRSWPDRLRNFRIQILQFLGKSGGKAATSRND